MGFNSQKMKDGLRQCYKCKEYLPLNKFSVARFKNKPDGFRPACKSCENKRAKLYQENNKEKVKVQKRKSSLKSQYGISSDDFDVMLAKQEYRCAICKIHQKDLKGRVKVFCVDHDRTCCPTHNKTCGNCIRGLLCPACNRGIGLLNDNPTILRRAADYVTYSRKGKGY